MSAWGKAAWENDYAGDWYDDLFEVTGLAQHVENALNQDVEDNAEVIRAAAYLLVVLGHEGIWPLDDLDRHLALAITKLEAVRALEESRGFPEFASAIDKELALLRSRLQPGGERDRETK